MCDSTSIDQFSPPMQPYPILIPQSQTINSLSFGHTQPIPDPSTNNHPIPSQSIHHSPSIHPDPESACVIPPLSTSSVHPCSHTQSSFHNHRQSILSLLVIRNQFLTLSNNHHQPPNPITIHPSQSTHAANPHSTPNQSCVIPPLSTSSVHPCSHHPILVPQSQTINSLSFGHTQPIPDPFQQPPNPITIPITIHPSQSIHAP